MTTLPKRVKGIRRTIDSILKQTVLPDLIIINFPIGGAKRDKSGTKKTLILLDQLKTLSKRINVRYTKDYGPITKLRPTIEFCGLESNDDIITIDDDIIYPPNMIETLLRFKERYPGCAISFRGRCLAKPDLKYNKSKLYICRNVKKPKQVDIITGTFGALYNPTMFDSFFFSADLDSPVFFNDDLWISGCLAKREIRRIVVPLKQTPVESASHNIIPLWGVNRLSKNNDYGISLFKEYW